MILLVKRRNMNISHINMFCSFIHVRAGQDGSAQLSSIKTMTRTSFPKIPFPSHVRNMYNLIVTFTFQNIQINSIRNPPTLYILFPLIRSSFRLQRMFVLLLPQSNFSPEFLHLTVEEDQVYQYHLSSLVL